MMIILEQNQNDNSTEREATRSEYHPAATSRFQRSMNKKMSLSSVSSGSLLALEGSVAEGSFETGPVAEELEEEGSESEESECSYQSLLSSEASFVSTDTIMKEMNRWFPMRCNKCETPVNGTVFVCSCSCMFCEGKE